MFHPVSITTSPPHTKEIFENNSNFQFTYEERLELLFFYRGLDFYCPLFLEQWL